MAGPVYFCLGAHGKAGTSSVCLTVTDMKLPPKLLRPISCNSARETERQDRQGRRQPAQPTERLACSQHMATPARARLPAKIKKQTLTVERLDCFAVALLGEKRGAKLLTFARSKWFNAFTVVVTMLSLINFIVFTHFRAKLFALLGSASKDVTVETFLATATDQQKAEWHAFAAEGLSFREAWTPLNWILWVLQIAFVAVLFLSQNIPAAKLAYVGFVGLFTLYNVARWAYSFGVSFRSGSAHISASFITFLTAILLCWIAADAMQIHRYLRMYLGIWLLAYLGSFLIGCLFHVGFYSDADLLFGIGASAGIALNASDTHLAASFTIWLFILKDVFVEFTNPGTCSVIKATVGKQWLYNGENDKNDEYRDQQVELSA